MKILTQRKLPFQILSKRQFFDLLKNNLFTTCLLSLSSFIDSDIVRFVESRILIIDGKITPQTPCVALRKAFIFRSTSNLLFTGFDEGQIKWVRIQWPRFKLRVKLSPNEKRMVWYFYHFHKFTIQASSGYNQTCFF